MKLNPEKCTFGVKSGKFLGYLVSQRGIDANPDKIRAITDLQEPKSIKDIQKLTGRMAALTRFISKSADKALPFFKILRATKTFTWGPEQSEAFQEVKRHLMNLPTITSPVKGETLQLYISASCKTVGSVLLVERQKVQHPVYFVSHVLTDAETRYPLVEKLAYAVAITARKLKPYFEAFPIQILTNYPMEKALQKLDASGRLLRWAIELSEYEIEVKPRTAIKAQALADFIVEASYEEEEVEAEDWNIAVDGSAADTGSGAGVVIRNPDGLTFEYALKFNFKATNNEAEYEAAIAGVKMGMAAGAKKIRLQTDSQLVAGQMQGDFQTKEPAMAKYVEQLRSLVLQLQKFEIKLVSREENKEADALARLASSDLPKVERAVKIEILQEKSIVRTIMVHSIEQAKEWFTDIVQYKLHRKLPDDPSESKRVMREEKMYCIVNGELFKKSFSYPLLKCATEKEAVAILEEIHEGICGNHIGGKSLAFKALRSGYYWPTLAEDAKKYVQKCEKCQKYAPVINLPPNELQPILSPVPFAQWGTDILGPFTTGTAGRKFLIVAIDYFTKWIEAEAVAKIKISQVKGFLWKNILTRFGLPTSVVFDHGKQFDNGEIKKFLSNFKIRFAYSSVTHPQSNGQAEAANKQILNALKKKIDEFKGAWVELIPEILWANRVTEKEATGETPFRLTFGSEAILPVEVGLPSLRVKYFDPIENEQAQKAALDLLAEVRLKASLRMAAEKERISKFYNKRVKHREFQEGDLVLRRTAATGKGNAEGKFTANWEGPYKITKVIGPGTFQLTDMQGKELVNTWNATVLKRYFV